MKEIVRKLNKRIDAAVGNENGAGALEAIIIIAVMIALGYLLLRWLGAIIDFSNAATKQSIHTGW